MTKTDAKRGDSMCICKKLIDNIEYGISCDNWELLKSEYNFNIHFSKHLLGLKGMLLHNAGAYTIIINEFLNKQEQLKAIKHELMHLYNDDFKRGKPLFDKENI